MKEYKDFPYNYEVHIAGYKGADFSGLPEPFFVNEIVSEDPIAKIVTAEVDSIDEAMLLFHQIQEWSRQNLSLQECGCRITVEQMLQFTGFNLKSRQPIDISVKQWHYTDNAYITFADVHADGLWDEDLARELVQKRHYLSLDYINRKGKQLKVLTLHFAPREAALQEARYLQSILQKGGFRGELSVEDSRGVEVIGPRITRPVITDIP